VRDGAKVGTCHYDDLTVKCGHLHPEFIQSLSVEPSKVLPMNSENFVSKRAMHDCLQYRAKIVQGVVLRKENTRQPIETRVRQFLTCRGINRVNVEPLFVFRGLF